MPTATFTAYDQRPYAEVSYQVKYVPRTWTHEDGHVSRLGGYRVIDRATGRDLGWIVEHDGRWETRVSEAAFRGAGPDDTGNLLDNVPADLTRQRTDGGYDAIAIDATRGDAAVSLLRWLRDHQAPALGFGAHYRVRCWADR